MFLCKTFGRAHENKTIQHFVSWGYGNLQSQIMGQSRDWKLLLSGKIGMIFVILKRTPNTFSIPIHYFTLSYLKSVFLHFMK